VHFSCWRQFCLRRMTIPIPTAAKALNHRRHFLGCLQRYVMPQASIEPKPSARASAFWHFAASARRIHRIYGAFVHHGCSLLHCICITVQIIGHFTHLGLGLDTSSLGISMRSLFFSRFGVSVDKALSYTFGVCNGKNHEEPNHYHIDGRFFFNIGSGDRGGCRDWGDKS
jgi:hypothetical protein